MRRRLVIVALVGTVAAALFALRIVAEFDWNPTAPIKFGEAFSEHNEYARRLLGEIVIAPEAGHDGKFFFSQAVDPFYLEPEVHARYLDRPSYRAQRMLYPTLASLGGVLPPRATAWGLIVVNILAMGVGTAYTAAIARRMGLSEWFGLAFTLNPGFFLALAIDGAGALAGAGLMAGIYYTMRRSLGPAAVALTLAVLARETMLIGAAGLALFWWVRRKQTPWPMAAPVVAAFAWWVYVHLRLEEGTTQDLDAVGLPMVGFSEAATRWLGEGGAGLPSLLMGVLLLVVSISLLLRSIRNPTEIGWATAGFALLGLLLSEPVWHRYFDSARALAPVLSGYLLLVPALDRTAHSQPRDADRLKHSPRTKVRS